MNFLLELFYKVSHLILFLEKHFFFLRKMTCISLNMHNITKNFKFNKETLNDL